MKTGQVYYRDENGDLYLAESFQNELGEVWTVHTKIVE